MLSALSIANVNLPFANMVELFHPMVKSDPVQKHRVVRLAKLVQAKGGIAAFVRTLPADEEGKTREPSYISALLGGHRNFGEKAARKLAVQAGLAQNYFDMQDDESEPRPERVLPVPVEKLVEHLLALTPEQQKEFADLTLPGLGAAIDANLVSQKKMLNKIHKIQTVGNKKMENIFGLASNVEPPPKKKPTVCTWLKGP